MGSEICRNFNLRPSPANEEDVAIIDQLWKDYERKILFKLNGIEEKFHDRRCGNPGGWCKCRTRQDEIHEWEDWAINQLERGGTDIDWRLPEAALRSLGCTDEEIEQYRPRSNFEKLAAR